MEKRIGAAIIIIENNSKVETLNRIISEHSDMIIGRQGIPLRERQMNIISLVLEGTTDDIGSLTGKIGRIPGIKIKSVSTPMAGDHQT